MCEELISWSETAFKGPFKRTEGDQSEQRGVSRSLVSKAPPSCRGGAKGSTRGHPPTSPQQQRVKVTARVPGACSSRPLSPLSTPGPARPRARPLGSSPKSRVPELQQAQGLAVDAGTPSKPCTHQRGRRGPEQTVTSAACKPHVPKSTGSLLLCAFFTPACVFQC